MTAITTTDRPRSRRALLAGALGGLGAWAAAAATRVDPAAAAAGEPIRMGRTNKAGGTQTILQTNSHGAAFEVRQASGAPAIRGETTSGRAVVGIAGRDGTGVWGESPNHVAVKATTGRGVGVEATSGKGDALLAVSTSTGLGARVHSVQGIGLKATGSVAAVHASSPFGYAGDFEGSVRVQWYQDFSEHADPGAPGANNARVFARDNGSGKTQLCVRFPTGAVQVIATEP